MSLIAYHKGQLGSDSVAVEFSTGVRTITQMRKLFTSSTNDFHYGFVGGNIVSRHHPMLQGILRSIVTDVLKGRSSESNVAKLEAFNQTNSNFIVLTKDLVITIKGFTDRTICAMEYEFDDIITMGTNDLMWRLAYMATGKFKASVKKSCDFANCAPSDYRFLNSKSLVEFIPCE